MTLVFVWLAIPVFSSWAAVVSLASSTSETSSAVPHPHQGKVPPYRPTDPKELSLSPKVLKLLESGRPFRSQLVVDGAAADADANDDGGSGGGSRYYSGQGIVIQDIHAPPSIVWDHLLDVDRYHQRIPNVVTSTNTKFLKRERLEQRSYWTSLLVGFSQRKNSNNNWNIHLRQDVYPDATSRQFNETLLWKLDYSKASDVDESVGYWHVQPHPTKKGRGDDAWSRVIYQIHLSLEKDRIPKVVWKFITRHGLTEATSWLKRYSEAAYMKELGRTAQEARRQPTEPLQQLTRQTKNKTTALSTVSPTAATPVSSEMDSISHRKGDVGGARLNTTTTRKLPHSWLSTSIMPSTAPLPSTLPKDIGMERYILIASATGLALLNIYLYFSHYR